MKMSSAADNSSRLFSRKLVDVLLLAGLLAYALSFAFPHQCSGFVNESGESGIYSYGNSTGISPVSLLIPTKREPITPRM
jgi:hypothetical protein